MTNEEIIYRNGSVGEVVNIINTIPEFIIKFDAVHINNHLTGTDFCITVACHNNLPIGFSISINNKHNKWVELWIAAIKVEYRGIGIMSQIVSRNEIWARSLKYSRVIADINQRNMPMLQLHLKLGYFITGIKFDNSYTTSKVFLEKPL